MNMPGEAQSTLSNRIAIDPDVMVGKPVVRGTRIPVERVLAYLELHDRDDVQEAFPELTELDVQACICWARAAVEREYRAAI